MEIKALNQIRTSILKNELQKAIDQLYKLLEGSQLLNEVTLQSARYNELMKQIRMGTLDYETASVSKNRITNALIDMISILESKGEEDEKVKYELLKKSKGSGLILNKLDAKKDVDVTVEQKNSEAEIKDISSGGDITIDIKQE